MTRSATQHVSPVGRRKRSNGCPVRLMFGEGCVRRVSDVSRLPPDIAQSSAFGGEVVYEQIFDNALVGICFMAGRCFIRVNRQMEAMLGYGPGELTGQSVRSLYASSDDFDEVGRVLRSFPKSNRYVHERPLVTKSGGILWCLISGSQITPGRPNSTSVWIVQDISARKRAEDQLTRTKDKLEHIVARRTLNLQRTNKALRQEVARRRESDRTMIESREKYRILIRNAPIGIILTNEAGELIEINPASMRMFGAADPKHLETIARNSTILHERSKRRESLADFLASLASKKGRKFDDRDDGYVVWSNPWNEHL